MSICSLVVLCLGPLGCGNPSTQDESAFRDFYSAVDTVWDLRSARGDPAVKAKLDAAVARVEQEAVRYKAIPSKARKTLYERNKAIHDGSINKYKQMLAVGGTIDYDSLAIDKKMSDLLVDAFGAKVTTPPPGQRPREGLVQYTSVLYAYDQAYKQ